ncbi:uncharacterized protein [Rutidosis leptorrhynchoides]|uniref:uncharacterized protein n=1 Tax=Rutidosis leptorrhynchoides TaxID=125765 RepID=UPI003A9A1FD7
MSRAAPIEPAKSTLPESASSSGDLSPERPDSGSYRSFGDQLRGVQWRIDLGILPSSSSSSSIDDFRRVTANSRRSYAALRRRLLINHHVPKDENNFRDHVMDNPLSQNPDSMWGRFFHKAELEKMVDQDLSRLYPEHGSYFQTPGCQVVLRRILLLWSIRHPNYGYRQGMHELLAPLLYVLQADLERLSEVRKQYQDYFTDNFDGLSLNVTDSSYMSDLEKDSPDDIETQNDNMKVNDINELEPKIQTIISFSDAYGAEGELGIVLSEKFMEHDAYSMFDALMIGDKGAVSMASFFSHSPSPQNGLPPVIEASSALYHLLSIVDLSLYTHLVELGVEPQYFSLRWLRVLFGREFALEDLLVVWDEIFALDNNRSSVGSRNVADVTSGVLNSSRGAFISSLAVSMILYLRSSLLATENPTTCLQRLLNFPEDVNLVKLIKKAKSLMNLAIEAINSIPEPVHGGKPYESGKPRGRSLSTDLTTSGSQSQRSLVRDSYWEEKWQVMNKEEEGKRQASLNKHIQNRIKSWSERVKMRLSRSESAFFLSKVTRSPVRRNLVDNLAQSEKDEKLVTDTSSTENGANTENSSIFNDPLSLPVSATNNNNNNHNNEEVASPLPVSDPPEDIIHFKEVKNEISTNNLRDMRPNSGKFQWLWMFARPGPEGSVENSGYTSEPTISPVAEYNQKNEVPSTSTTADDISKKREAADQNKMYSLHNLAESMLENIEVIESIFRKEKFQTEPVDNLSINAMAALEELRKISNLLSEM